MTIKIGINGFGRMGRLVLRAAWDWPEVEFVRVNDPAGEAATLAHLLTFDSVHGRWGHQATADGDAILVNGQRIATSRSSRIEDTDWSGCDLVIEASGKMKKVEVLNAYLAQGVERVVVTAPVKEPEVLDVVMGVNDHLYQPQTHRIVTAASCTTNCLAPVVKVIHEHLGIRHGSMTTIHNLTKHSDHSRRPPQGFAPCPGLRHEPDSHHYRLGNRDHRNFPGAQGAPEWPRGAGAPGQRLAD